MIPIKIAIDSICCGSHNNNNFRFNTLHDHQTSQALKSIIIACSSSVQLADEVVTSILQSNTKNNNTSSNFAHLCFFLLTVAGNDDVFLSGMEDAISNMTNNNNDGIKTKTNTMSPTDRRKQASSLFLQSFFPSCTSFIKNQATKKATEQDEVRYQKMYRTFQFLDSFFDLWYQQVIDVNNNNNNINNNLIQKTFVKGYSDVKSLMMSKEFHAKIICEGFVNEVLQQTVVSTTTTMTEISLSAIMSFFQLFRLLGSLELLVSTPSSSTSASSSSIDVMISSFASCLRHFKELIAENMSPAVELLSSTSSDNNTDGWSLFSSGIDTVIATLEPVNFIPVSLRVCDTIIDAGSSTSSTTSSSSSCRSLLIESVKRWKEEDSSSTSSSTTTRNNNINLPLLHILACDCIKLGFVRGGDVGLRIFSLEQEEELLLQQQHGDDQLRQNASYSTGNAFVIEMIDTLLRILMKNQNQSSRVGSLVLNLLMVLASPIEHSSSSSSSASPHLSCFFNLNHFEKFLSLSQGNDDERIKKLLLFIVLDKPLLAVSSFVKNTSFNNKKNNKNSNKILNYFFENKQFLPLNVIERICVELVRSTTTANDDSDIENTKQQWISLLPDESELKVELLSSSSSTSSPSRSVKTILTNNLSPALKVKVILNIIRDKVEKSTTTSTSTSNENHNTSKKALTMMLTPGDIYYNTNKEEELKEEETPTTKKKEFYDSLKSTLVSLPKNDRGTEIIIEFMKQGIINGHQHPESSPMIVSILGSEEVKEKYFSNRRNCDDSNNIVTIMNFLRKSLKRDDDDENTDKHGSGSGGDPLHKAIAPLICLRIATTPTTSSEILDIALSQFGVSSSSKRKNKNKNEEDDDDDIVIDDNDSHHDNNSNWNFPEYRKMMAEILVHCCCCSSGDVDEDSSSAPSNLTRLVEFIVNSTSTCTSTSSSSLSRRFFMLLSCQLILSVSCTNKHKLNKKKNVLQNIHRLSCHLRDVAMETLKRITKTDFTNQEQQQQQQQQQHQELEFQACADSISISFLGAVACRCVDSVTYDRAVFDWIAHDESVFQKMDHENKNNRVVSEFIIPEAQEHTAKSIILIVKRDLFKSCRLMQSNNNKVNAAQLWNAIGPSLTSSVLYSLQLPKETHHHQSKMTRRNLSLQLISAVSILSNYCITKDHDKDDQDDNNTSSNSLLIAGTYGQCLFDIMTIFVNGAKYVTSSNEDNADVAIFSSLLKMVVSVVGMAVDDQVQEQQHNIFKKQFEEKKEVFKRDWTKMENILQDYKEQHGYEYLQKERADDLELIEFLLEMV